MCLSGIEPVLSGCLLLLSLMLGSSAVLFAAQTEGPPPLEDCSNEPVKVTNAIAPDKALYDGGLPHALGVHRYQALRANRTHALEGGTTGWTYNHQPYLAYWRDRFYLQYLSNPVSEHVPPGRTLLLTSVDGREWSDPKGAFPIYPLPEISTPDGLVSAGTGAVMHQRMGFYTAPNGRLLTLGFYGICPNPRHGPNKGDGIGRVVREILSEDKMGPIYFIRYNRHAGWNESNTEFPFYATSADRGFVDACEALLADKLMTLQWWEEDRAKDGFFSLDPSQEVKALCTYHRPDGVVVALWKRQLASLSPDEGKTWSPLGHTPTVMECSAKTWGQRTADERYALVYNHSATRRNRFPMVVVTGDDGYTFDQMLCLEGEVAPMRYWGLYKNVGSQYVRGIDEGNGTPPGSFLWNTWSMNKEDIWVCRTRVPVTGSSPGHLNEDFENLESVQDLEFWNLYSPLWAPVRLVSERGKKCLALEDEEPWDYALVESHFPASSQITVGFRAKVEPVGHGIPEMELQSDSGTRCFRMRFQPGGLSLDLGATEGALIRCDVRDWHEVMVRLDGDRQKGEVFLDGQALRKDIAFDYPVDKVKRLVFRTGSWRGDVRHSFEDGEPGATGINQEDLPGADEKVPLTRFLISRVWTEPRG